jgi:tRNA pseudouridine32 synthase/23S rRNA pseudouridine746 synthase
MDTSGVMVFAKTSEAAVNLRRQFEDHTVRKTYMAKVSADTDIPSGKGAIDLPLSPDYDERPRQKIDFRQGKPAYTEYEIIRNHEDGTADLLLYPHTGRTHQLRIHCAHHLGLGRPIVGDLLYGGYSVFDNKASEPALPARLCLHALSITFCHPLTAKELTFTSEKLAY